MKLIVHDGDRVKQVEVARKSDGFAVTVGERTYHVDAASARAGLRSLRIDGSHHEVAVRDVGDLGGDPLSGKYWVSTPSGAGQITVTDPLTHLAAQSHGRAAHRREKITAYMPGRVVALLAQEGEAVTAGQGVVVLEAMKMENEIKAEHDGTIIKIHVEPGQAVEGGDPLFELD